MAEPDTEDSVQLAAISPPEIVRFLSVDVGVNTEVSEGHTSPVPIPDPYAPPSAALHTALTFPPEITRFSSVDVD
jgi:hypothetical protein